MGKSLVLKFVHLLVGWSSLSNLEILLLNGGQQFYDFLFKF